MLFKPLLLLALMWWWLPARAAYENPSEAFQLTREEETPSSEDILIRRPEKHARDEKMVKELNDDLGIHDNRRWTGEDRNRISAAFHLNGQYEFMRDGQGFEASWLRRTDNWSKLWWGVTFRNLNTGFGNITQNRSNDSGSPDAEGTYQRPKDAKQTIMSVGPGVGYRFRLLTDFMNTENTFETVNVWGMYTALKESFIGENYRGWGMSADYALHRRVRSSFFWGGKFTYNMAWVARPKRGTESSQDRTLSLGWYTLGLEAGFYF